MEFPFFAAAQESEHGEDCELVGAVDPESLLIVILPCLNFGLLISWSREIAIHKQIVSENKKCISSGISRCTVRNCCVFFLFW